MRKIKQKQEKRVLINEEALLFAKYLRGEKPAWNPRLPSIAHETWKFHKN